MPRRGGASVAGGVSGRRDWRIVRPQEDVNERPALRPDPVRLAESALERDQADKIHLCRRVKLGSEVDVAVFGGIATRDRAEEPQTANTRLAQFRLVGAQRGDHMLGQVGRNRVDGAPLRLTRKRPARFLLSMPPCCPWPKALTALIVATGGSLRVGR